MSLLWIGRESLWLDEATSARLATEPWRSFVDEIAREKVNMSAYFVALRAWALLGTDEAVLRSLSAVAAAATVPCLYAVGRRLLDRRTAAIACLLFAVSPGTISFAQEARGYAAAVFFVTLSTLLLLRCLDAPSPGRASGYAAAIALGIYCHLFVLFVLAVQVGALVLRGPAGRRSAARALPVVGLLLVPLALYGAYGNTDHLGWVQRPTVRDLASVPVHLVGSRPLGALLVIVATAGALWLLWRAQRRTLWRAWWLVGWCLVPLLGAYVLSLVVKPILVPRYLFVAMPSWMLLAAVPLAAIRGRIPRLAASGVLVAGSLVAIGDDYQRRTNDDWRSAAAAVAAAVRPGDALVFDPPYAKRPFDYYANRQPMIYARARPMPPGDAGVAAARSSRRVWLIRTFTTDPRAQHRLGTALSAGRRKHTMSLRGVGVTLFVR